MGHGIAQVYAQNGYNVSLHDLTELQLENALTKIRSNMNAQLEFGRLNQNDIDVTSSHIKTSTNLENVARDADLVVEAVSEVREVKAELFSRLNAICKEDAILASNTSSLDIFKLAKEIQRPERLVIQHWFAPPHIIPLVEIVPGRKTSKEVIETSVQLMNMLGKTPVVLKRYSEDFIVNKIQNAISSAIFTLMLSNVATPEEIDKAVKYTLGIRMPIIGVVQSLDFTGLDLVYDIAKAKNVDLTNIKEKIDQGCIGVKSGAGLFDYQGRTEEEILKSRDAKFFQLLDFLKGIHSLDPI